MRFIATVAFKGRRVELTFTVSGHFEVLEPTRGCDEITGIGAVAISFALGTTFSPRDSDERI
jgi:hypothetical protein